MIILQVIGGLGNQFFQYAFARRLSIDNCDEIAFDTSHYELHINRWTNVRKALGVAKRAIIGKTKGYKPARPREFLLDRFNVTGTVLSKQDLGQVKSRLGKETAIVREAHFDFDQSVLNAKGDIYLEGFWQSWKYFGPVADKIRAELTLKDRLGDCAHMMKKEIESDESVSLHVRRMDYLIGKSFGTTSLEYYTKAIELIRSKTGKPHFFVFTDDVEWSEKNIKTGGKTTMVSGHGISDCEELMLMSFCKHQITVNSSFSWWGAWLNPNPEKIIATPAKWFLEEQLNTKNRIPPEWIKIDVNDRRYSAKQWLP